MIRTRLAIAFALLALLAGLQGGFAWWAASSAAHHAERSVVATRLLAGYLALSGDKQRLKVWFAERMLSGEADPNVRDRLIASMWASVGELRELLPLAESDPAGPERQAVEAVSLNISALERAVLEADRADGGPIPPQEWRRVILAFDESAGQDMRLLLREAVQRHHAASLRESAALARALAHARKANTAMALAVVLLALAAVVYFLHAIERPFAQLARVTEDLGRGDFQARSGLSGRDEFSRIGQLLDSMAGRLEEARIRSAALQQRLDALVGERTRAVTQAYESLLELESRRRRFLAELGHELRTPATVIRGEADLALRGSGEPDTLRQALRRIVEACEELAARVRELLEAAREGRVAYALQVQGVPLAAVVAAAVEQMQAVAQHRGIRLAVRAVPAGEAMVAADRERLQQALVVVLDNALRYLDAGGRVEVEVGQDADGAWVQVDDDGPGMAAEELEQAFEPHFRGRAGRERDARGLGLGLSIARRIVAAHGGNIELVPRQPQGLSVRFTLPAGVPA
ncbi:sensor histidine kinase [Silanimonas lenta]|uniref:sensor histidine kinase n=1 Tax=Silanimonas lenta TaxID=265429 RepID=UPI00041C5E40|nr:HAMP domain-containing sensor histidine kinase [Silanimonas lenta]